MFGHGKWTQYYRPTGLRKYGVDHHFSVLEWKLSWPACPSTGWPSDSEWSWRFRDPIPRLCRDWHEVTWFGCFTLPLLSLRGDRTQLSSSSANRNQHPQQDPGWSGECTWSSFLSEGKPSRCNELCPLSDTDSPEDSRQEEECHQWGSSLWDHWTCTWWRTQSGWMHQGGYSYTQASGTGQWCQEIPSRWCWSDTYSGLRRTAWSLYRIWHAKPMHQTRDSTRRNCGG